jgi:hypothetical protein
MYEQMCGREVERYSMRYLSCTIRKPQSAPLFFKVRAALAFHFATFADPNRLASPVCGSFGFRSVLGATSSLVHKQVRSLRSTPYASRLAPFVLNSHATSRRPCVGSCVNSVADLGGFIGLHRHPSFFHELFHWKTSGASLASVVVSFFVGACSVTGCRC